MGDGKAHSLVFGRGGIVMAKELKTPHSQNLVIIPEYMSLRDWSSALISDFSSEMLPFLDDEDKWQEWAQIVSTTGLFNELSVPSPLAVKEDGFMALYDKWQDWAFEVYNIISTQ
jgi:hypothetical protein